MTIMSLSSWTMAIGAAVTGGSEVTAALRLSDPTTQTWTTSDPNVVEGGSSAMYDTGKVIKAGSATDSGQPANPSASTAYITDLGQAMADTVVLTMSEFGRAVNENGNRGTDHGHGNAMMVIGGNVRGGRVYGRWPGLWVEHRYEGRDLAVTTDFRDVFGEIVVRHLGVADAGPIFPGYAVQPGRFPGLFASGCRRSWPRADNHTCPASRAAPWAGSGRYTCPGPTRRPGRTRGSAWDRAGWRRRSAVPVLSRTG